MAYCSHNIKKDIEQRRKFCFWQTVDKKGEPHFEEEGISFYICTCKHTTIKDPQKRLCAQDQVNHCTTGKQEWECIRNTAGRLEKLWEFLSSGFLQMLWESHQDGLWVKLWKCFLNNFFTREQKTSNVRKKQREAFWNSHAEQACQIKTEAEFERLLDGHGNLSNRSSCKKTVPVINREILLKNSRWKGRLHKARKCCDQLWDGEGRVRKHRKQNSKGWAKEYEGHPHKEESSRGGQKKLQEPSFSASVDAYFGVGLYGYGILDISDCAALVVLCPWSAACFHLDYCSVSAVRACYFQKKSVLSFFRSEILSLFIAVFHHIAHWLIAT